MFKATMLFVLVVPTIAHCRAPTKIVIEKGPSGGLKQTVSIEIAKSGQREVWRSKDGKTTCSIDPWGASHPNSTTYFFECYLKGMKTQLTGDCLNNLGKTKSMTYFVGGEVDYNQNFEIWCE